MRRMAITSLMAKRSRILHSDNFILTQDHIAPSRPITPSPISPEPGPYTFGSRPEVIESLRDDLERLSQSKMQPYTIVSLSTPLDNSC